VDRLSLRVEQEGSIGGVRLSLPVDRLSLWIEQGSKRVAEQAYELNKLSLQVE
jgi:hypothetical protein